MQKVFAKFFTVQTKHGLTRNKNIQAPATSPLVSFEHLHEQHVWWRRGVGQNASASRRKLFVLFPESRKSGGGFSRGWFGWGRPPLIALGDSQQMQIARGAGTELWSAELARSTATFTEPLRRA